MTQLTPSQSCIDLIKRFEGVRHAAYPDPATGCEPWTIGVGHCGPEVHPHLVWTDSQVDAALLADLNRFTISMRSLIGSSSTTQHQFDAMISLMFNIGPSNFAHSSVIANHLNRRYRVAQAAFLLWNKAGGKVMAGLTHRRAAEAELYGS